MIFEVLICISIFYSDQEKQIARLIGRSTLSIQEAEKRVKSQMPMDKKCEKSHFVIDNSGYADITILETEKILKSLNASRQHWKIRAFMFIALSGFLSLLLWLDTIFKFLPFNAFRNN